MTNVLLSSIFGIGYPATAKKPAVVIGVAAGSVVSRVVGGLS